MNSVRTIFVFVSLLGLLLGSCRNSDRDIDTSTDATRDNLLALILMNDVVNQVHHVVAEDATLDDAITNTNDTIGIDTITISGATFPKTITIDYGTTNSSGSDGRNRRGKIYAVFSGEYLTNLTTITITPTDYYVDDFKVIGTLTLTQLGINVTTSYREFSESISGGEIIGDTADISEWTAAGITREWVGGSATSTTSDDQFELSGTISGRGTKGNTFSTKTTSDLVFATNCNWISGGSMQVSPTNLSPRNVDIGSGCDANASINLNGSLIDVLMK